MRPGFAKSRSELPWLYYPEQDRVIINAHNFGGGYDTDAAAYIAAVEAADSASLATKYKDAINAFVVGAKSDGFWTAIKAACFLAGPATLSGALVPLVGTAPSNSNFVSGDHSQSLGLTGNGTNKKLTANRLGDADPQDNCSMGVYLTGTRATVDSRYISAAGSVKTIVANGTGFRCRANNSTLRALGSGSATAGLIGFSRSGSASYSWRHTTESGTQTDASISPTSAQTYVYSSSAVADFCVSRLSFYWIGEALSLTNLSARLDTYMAAIA